jgi:hypothetical protein
VGGRKAAPFAGPDAVTQHPLRILFVGVVATPVERGFAGASKLLCRVLIAFYFETMVCFLQLKQPAESLFNHPDWRDVAAKVSDAQIAVIPGRLGEWACSTLSCPLRSDQ